MNTPTPEDLTSALDLLDELTCTEPCRYDHHGNCQEHFTTEHPCPHARARELLRRHGYPGFDDTADELPAHH